MQKAIEKNFPFESVDFIAEKESYRKEINRPIYHIHKWWARRLGSVFRAIVSGALSNEDWPNFYESQEFSDKVILDPFMGSGTTLGEAAKLGAKVVGCDVNPVSTFIVQQALTGVDVSELKKEFQSIEKDVSEKIQSFYRTLLPGSKTPSQALYYFWVKIVVTPEGEEIPLFNSYVFSKNAYPSKKPESQIFCPSCESIFKDRYDTTEAECPICRNVFNPQNGPCQGSRVLNSKGNSFDIKKLVQEVSTPPRHKLYAIMALDEAGNRVYIKPSKFDFDLLESAKRKLESIRESLPLPRMEVREGHNTKQVLGYNYRYWRDFFSDRQLLCLGILLKRILEIKNKEIRDHFVCLFSGTTEFNNLFCSFKGEGTGAVRHMFSNHILKPERTPLENSVWGTPGKSSGTFSTLFKSRLLKAKQYLREPFEISVETNNGKTRTEKKTVSRPIDLSLCNNWMSFGKTSNAALILNGDSSNLPLPSSCVDAVVTDPPYFDFIHYSELSDFFFSWISNVLGDDYPFLNRADSSHENEVQDKDYIEFSRKLGVIFSECQRVLKDSGLLCFSYHHSTIEGWIAIFEAIKTSTLSIVASHPVKAEMSVTTIKSKTKSPINLDAILVCKKNAVIKRVDDPQGDLSKYYSDINDRFSKVGRKLSSMDSFVILCSRALVIGSSLGMTSEEVEALILEGLKQEGIPAS